MRGPDIAVGALDAAVGRHLADLGHAPAVMRHHLRPWQGPADRVGHAPDDLALKRASKGPYPLRPISRIRRSAVKSQPGASCWCTVCTATRSGVVPAASANAAKGVLPLVANREDGYGDPKRIQEDPDFQKISQYPAFVELMHARWPSRIKMSGGKLRRGVRQPTDSSASFAI